MLKHIRLIFRILLASAVLSSCAADSNRYLPVFHTKPRVSTLGFTISPPPGDNWYEKVSENSIYYLKKIEPKNYFIYTRATELHFGERFSNNAEFLNYVKSKKEVNTAPELFKNSSSFYEVSDKIGNCVSYHQQYEDHSLIPVSSSNRRLVASVTSNGLVCMHPSKPGVGIDLYYLERKLPGSEFVSYAEEGEKFLGSLSFLAAQNNTTL